MTDGLKEAHRSAIVDVLRANPRVERAVLFGSRAKQTFTRGSDVDIALFGESLTIADQARLATDMDELTVPQRVDLLLYDGIEDATLRKHVRQDGIELYRRERCVAEGNLNLTERHREMLVALLREHLPGVEAWAYGSRVNGRSHDGSDLDLALRGPGLKKIPVGQLADFREALYESTLPFLVEARDWARLPERFQREIERDHVVVDSDADRGKVEHHKRKRILGNQAPGPWDTKSLANLSENFDAIRVPVKEADRRPGPYPYYGASGVVDHVDQYLFDGEYLLVAEDGENLRTRNTPISFLANGKFWVNNHAHILRGNAQANTRYLMYALSHLDISGYLTGSTMPKLTQRNLARVAIPTPPLDQQCAIADILGALDDRIELNHRMTETLEAMARALFKSWFVDFEPVRAKMAGRETGLPRRIADLFPEKMFETDFGDMPEGWQCATLRSIIELNPESWSSRTPPDHVTYVDLKNTKWGRIEKRESFAWNNAPSRARRILRRFDTIVSTVRPGNGSYALIDEDGLTASTGFAVLRPLAPIDREIVWCASTSEHNIERLAHLADGGAYPAVRAETVAGTPIVLATDEIRRAFSEAVAPLLDKAGCVRRASASLARLRDALLPKLISGELRLTDAERIVGSMT